MPDSSSGVDLCINVALKSYWKHENLTSWENFTDVKIHGENFMAIFPILIVSVVIWITSGTLGIFATLVYVVTVPVGICDWLTIEIIPILWTSLLFCYLCYIELNTTTAATSPKPSYRRRCRKLCIISIYNNDRSASEKSPYAFMLSPMRCARSIAWT